MCLKSHFLCDSNNELMAILEDWNMLLDLLYALIEGDVQDPPKHS